MTDIEAAGMRKSRIVSLARANGPDWVDLECALWTCEILPEYAVKFLTLDKPAQVVEYERMPPEDRGNMGASYFHENGDVLPYYNKIHRRRQNNSRNKWWLELCREILLKHGKTEEVAKIEVMLKQFTSNLLLPKGV